MTTNYTDEQVDRAVWQIQDWKWCPKCGGRWAEQDQCECCSFNAALAPSSLGSGDAVELERLRGLINTPELNDFAQGAVLEAAGDESFEDGWKYEPPQICYGLVLGGCVESSRGPAPEGSNYAEVADFKLVDYAVHPPIPAAQGDVVDEDGPCKECGSISVDTGYECNDCGYYNGPKQALATRPAADGDAVAKHPDDAAVDAFADAMKAKLAEARAKGRGGWHDKTDCTQRRLSVMLRAHVDKGDPRDVANFCMFLYQRGEAILPRGRSMIELAADPTLRRDGEAVAQGDVWRCFHCNESFGTGESAAEHFGTSERQLPACQIDIAAYREMEQRSFRYQEEDTDLHRAMYRMQIEHQVALQREEERGYARGLHDAKLYPEDAAQPRAVPVALIAWSSYEGRGAEDRFEKGYNAARRHVYEMLKINASQPPVEPRVVGDDNGWSAWCDKLRSSIGDRKEWLQLKARVRASESGCEFDDVRLAPLPQPLHAVALAHFIDYFVRNYPGPNTIISNPHWHAPKIFRAALYAIDQAVGFQDDVAADTGVLAGTNRTTSGGIGKP